MSWVRGYKIPFKTAPRQAKPILNRGLSETERTHIVKLIVQLIAKGVIVECRSEKDQFLSNIFIVPKPDKSFRLILNLKHLNEFVETEHFKLEDYRTAMKLLEQDCYMSTIDLRDAYYLLPIDESHRKFLRFEFHGKYYQFTCLPFGLSSAPMVFTKLLKPVVGWLRQLGLCSVLYLDDFLLLGNTSLECASNFNKTHNLLENLGFIINYEKSQVAPVKRCRFLGFILDSSSMTLELPGEKRKAVKKLIQRFRNLSQCRIREFAQFIGTIIACCPAIKYSWVYTKEFERQKFLALTRNNDNYEAIMTLRTNVVDFTWWDTHIMSGIRSISNLEFVMEIYSDASLTGWGAVCKPRRCNGFWNSAEQQHHINFLELKAAYFGLKCLAKDLRNCSILLRIDNTTAISYINRMGGIQFENLNEITKQIWQWCESRDIWIFASYVSSRENVEADTESRRLEPETEYELSKTAFREIVRSLGSPDIDLFASRSNYKCNRYISWKQDPGSEAVDAFTLSWKEFFFLRLSSV